MVTVLDLAILRGAQPDIDGDVSHGEVLKTGLPFFIGCQCGKMLSAYTAFPSKRGAAMCERCVGDSGWESIEEAESDIFGGVALELV